MAGHQRSPPSISIHRYRTHIRRNLRLISCLEPTRYADILEDLKKDPESHGGPPDCILLCRICELILRELGFRDIFKKVKDEENAKAISLFPEVVRLSDVIEDDGKRIENLVRGIFAGNIFDLGSAQLAEVFSKDGISFLASCQNLVPRPWVIDDLDQFQARWLKKPWKKEVIFVDKVFVALRDSGFESPSLTQTIMSDHGEKTCPLCAEEMDLTDQQLKPCKCGYQLVKPSEIEGPADILYPEVILCVEIYDNRKVKTQEFMVLGRQLLSELKDKIHCITDQVMKKAGKYDPSGYLLIEDVFHNDLRNPSATD